MFLWKSFRKLWKLMWRKIMDTSIAQWFAALLMFIGIYVAFFTCWTKIENKKIFAEFKNRPAIFVFWHGRSMMLSPITRRIGIHGFAISSKHRDGRMMARLQRLFGLKPIFGSTGRDGAVSALRQGVRKLQDGNILALSPDGPRGPRMRLNDGALYFSRMTGAPIIPVCYSSSRPWFQNRWDKYLVCLPFSKIICNVGNPIYINKDNFESMKSELENIMIKQLQDLDAKFGLPKMTQGEIKKPKVKS